MKAILVLGAAIAVEIIVYRLWQSSDASDWWQRIALFIVGTLVLTAVLYAGVI